MRKMMGIAAMMLLVIACGCHHDNGGWVTVSEDQTQPPAPTPTAPVIPVTPVPVATPPTAPPVTGATKRAVLVGINKFKTPDAPPLSGCVPDAQHSTPSQLDTSKMHKRSIEHGLKTWGIDPKNVTLLLDDQATVANIKAALNAVVAVSKPGDTILYWQSSHGATDTDPQTGELYDLVCCYDFDWVPEFELTSKDYKAIFSKAQKGVIIGWGSDSCHSGDLDKKFTKNKKPVTPKCPNVPEAVRLRVAKAKALGLKSRSITDGVLDVCFISGCTTDQTSADSSDDNGHPAGALSFYFLKTIDTMDNSPMTAVGEAVDKILATDGYDQTPLVSGSEKIGPG